MSLGREEQIPTSVCWAIRAFVTEGFLTTGAGVISLGPSQ
jgi:hypothetical protein